jgi:glucose/arabinose dehydrogenase
MMTAAFPQTILLAGNGRQRAIYSYGHRNPQGFEKKPVTGAIGIKNTVKGGDGNQHYQN